MAYLLRALHIQRLHWVRDDFQVAPRHPAPQTVFVFFNFINPGLFPLPGSDIVPPQHPLRAGERQTPLAPTYWALV